MQDFTYSVFSIVAIAIHLIVNAKLILGRESVTAHGSRYRGFLVGVLAYYLADGAWGVFAGLRWIAPWNVDTILFFLSNVILAVTWCRFVVGYLEVGRLTSRLLVWCGYAILAVTVAALAANVSNGCVFSFGDGGVYECGYMRDRLFYLLIAYNLLVSAVVLAKTLESRDSQRYRNVMVFALALTMTVALTLQVIWPLTPFTALGCLIGNCFFHVFVIRDEQMAKHMAELESALERARSAEKARSMFFSIVSHDIRTPLNAILGYSELLRNGIGDEAAKAEALESIRASGSTLLQLVNDVLDLAKLDAGKVTFQPSPVRLDRLTDEVFSSFRLDAGRKGLELVNRTAGVPEVVLDSHRLRQILFNLVGNAVKFTPNGSVSVSASYAGGNLEVSVSDTGCGIAPDMLERIFDPFVQIVDPSHSAYNGLGTGLGLSICKRLVDAMGGRLSAASEPGRGATFTISIPGVESREPEGETRGAAGPSGAAKRMPRRVLVVDDSPVNRSVLKAFLDKAGIVSVDCACDGAEALAELDSAAKAGRPHDFVFSDFWMPAMNGFEFVEKLRADSRFRDLDVFAVTADTECSQDPRVKLFTGVLFKPLTYAKLLEVLA